MRRRRRNWSEGEDEVQVLKVSNLGRGREVATDRNCADAVESGTRYLEFGVPKKIRSSVGPRQGT